MFNKPFLQWTKSFKNIYLVGGAVRDAIRTAIRIYDADVFGVSDIKSLLASSKVDHDDFDFVVEDVAMENLSNILSKFGEVVECGASFRVIKFKPHGYDKCIDVAIPRKEISTGIGHNDFEVTDAASIHEDLARRDFTMNAIAIHCHTGCITDPFNGIDDIIQRRIVPVSANSYIEDPLRMMRACRFGSRLLVDNMVSGIQPHAHMIESVSKERIMMEFTKVLNDNAYNFEWFIMLLDASGLMEYILPEFIKLHGVKQPKQYHDFDVAGHIYKALEYTSGKDLDGITKMAILLHDIGKPSCITVDSDCVHFYGHDEVGEIATRRILTRMKFDNDFVEKVAKLVRHHMNPTIKEDVFRRKCRKNDIDRDMAMRLIEVQRADIYGCRKIMTEQAINFSDAIKQTAVSVFDKAKDHPVNHRGLAINGNDIMDAFSLQPGKIIGTYLNTALEAVDNGIPNDKEALLSFLKTVCI